VLQSKQLKKELEIVLKMIFFKVRRSNTELALLNEEKEPNLSC
jgi:hypothetical protein